MSLTLVQITASTAFIKALKRAQNFQKEQGDTYLAVDSLILGLLEDSQVRKVFMLLPHCIAHLMRECYALPETAWQGPQKFTITQGLFKNIDSNALVASAQLKARLHFLIRSSTLLTFI
jgi:hypothetical protein